MVVGGRGLKQRRWVRVAERGPRDGLKGGWVFGGGGVRAEAERASASGGVMSSSTGQQASGSCRFF